jgi:hypothetical protein
MTTTRTITGFVAGVAVALLLPSAAPANPLLSGYGGPGEGNQVLLGSQLLGSSGGPGTGGGGPGAAAGGSAAAGAGQAGGAAAAVQPASVTGGREGAAVSSSRGAAVRVRAKRRPAGAPAASGGSAPASSLAGSYPASDRGGPTPPSQTLGLSQGDLLLALLALCALASIGVLTRSLARVQDGGRQAPAGAAEGSSTGSGEDGSSDELEDPTSR